MCATASEKRLMIGENEFSLAALHAALDQRRRERVLSWSDVAREISAGLPIRTIAVATIANLGTRPTAEADGVLQMLRWLGRTPESFTAHESADPVHRLPDVPRGSILRFDTRKLHTALDARRRERAIPWTQVAREVGIAAPGLTRLAEGGRTAFPQVMRITRWLERPAVEFTRVTAR
jgi:hypothetical protein